MTVHFSVLCDALFACGVALFFLGGMLAMTFDISAWLPSLGVFLAVLGGAAAVFGLVAQVVLWTGIT